MQDSPIVIGALYNLTGAQSSLDQPSYQGAMLAVDQINKDGGILGNKIELMLRDGLSEPTTLKQQTLALLQAHPETVAFMGLSDTDMVLASAKVAADSHRVFLTSGATSPQLPAQVPEYLFLACFGDNVQAAAAAEFAYNEQDARKVAVVFDSTETYTSLLQGYFIARFEQLGGQITSIQAYGQSDLSAIANQLSGADLIFLAAMPQDALPAVQQIRNAGFTLPIIGGDAFDSETTWAGQTSISNVFFTTHAYLGADNPDQQMQAFRLAYRETYQHDPDAFAALGYDTVNLLAQAIKDAGSTEPAAILSALAVIQNFKGLTGEINFTAGDRIPKKSVAILEIQAGTIHLKMQVLPEQIPPP